MILMSLTIAMSLTSTNPRTRREHPEPVGGADDEDPDDHEPGRDQQDALDRQMIERHVVGAWSLDISTLSG